MWSINYVLKDHAFTAFGKLKNKQNANHWLSAQISHNPQN